MIIKYSQEVSDFINDHTKMEINGNDWCYIPTWFKKVGENMFEVYSFEKLPQEVQMFISAMRNIPTVEENNEN